MRRGKEICTTFLRFMIDDASATHRNGPACQEERSTHYGPFELPGAIQGFAQDSLTRLTEEPLQDDERLVRTVLKRSGLSHEAAALATRKA